jgi:hypothetical protein
MCVYTCYVYIYTCSLFDLSTRWQAGGDEEDEEEDEDDHDRVLIDAVAELLGECAKTFQVTYMYISVWYLGRMRKDFPGYIHVYKCMI